LTRSEKKIESFDIFRGNFPNPNSNHRWLTRPDKKFDPEPSLVCSLYTTRILVYSPRASEAIEGRLEKSLWFMGIDREKMSSIFPSVCVSPKTSPSV